MSEPSSNFLGRPSITLMLTLGQALPGHGSFGNESEGACPLVHASAFEHPMRPAIQMEREKENNRMRRWTNKDAEKNIQNSSHRTAQA